MTEERRTVYEHDGLLDGVLVTELRVQESPAHERPVEGGLVPTHVKMIDVHMTQAPHHLHLILNYRRRHRNIRVREGLSLILRMKNMQTLR